MSVIAFVLAVLVSFLPGKANTQVTVIPPMPTYAPAIGFVGESSDIGIEWFMYHIEAEREFRDEFTALFNATEVKWSKNHRLMVKSATTNTFKFVAKGK